MVPLVGYYALLWGPLALALVGVGRLVTEKLVFGMERQS